MGYNALMHATKSIIHDPEWYAALFHSEPLPRSHKLVATLFAAMACMALAIILREFVAQAAGFLVIEMLCFVWAWKITRQIPSTADSAPDPRPDPRIADVH